MAGAGAEREWGAGGSIILICTALKKNMDTRAMEISGALIFASFAGLVYELFEQRDLTASGRRQLQDMLQKSAGGCKRGSLSPAAFSAILAATLAASFVAFVVAAGSPGGH